MIKKNLIALGMIASLLFLSGSTEAANKRLPEPYNSINILPSDPSGWFGNQVHLDTIFDTYKPKVVIEVGSWLGASTLYFGKKVGSHGKVYAVDTWLGSDEKLHQNDPRLPQLFQHFLSNVIHAELADIIVPIRMLSTEAATALIVEADLIYIDGSHKQKDVVEDIYHWLPHLKPGGILCGDDWVWDEVHAGVIQAAAALNRRIHWHENFWWFEPIP